MNDNEQTAVVDEEEIPATEETAQEETKPAQPEETGERSTSSETDATDEGEPTEEVTEEVTGVDIVIDGETPPQKDKDEFAGQPAPQWAKDLRTKNRELEKQIRESNRQKKQEVEKQEQLVLGPRPELFDAGSEDKAKHDKALDDWYERKGKIDAEKERKVGLQKQERERMQQVETSYKDKKKAFSGLVKDYDDAEHAIEQALDQTQQGILLTGADNPATMAYTLFKRPALLEQMSKIKDPVKFAIALGELQKSSTVKPRKPTTKPEKTVTGTSPGGGSVDQTLDKLREEAARSGNFSKVSAHKRKIKEAAKAAVP